MEFEALTCPVCRANMPYTELVSGKRIIQCQVCRACMENPRFGEFRSPEPVALHLRMPFLTALFASASVVFASTLILVGMGLVNVDFGALFGMIGVDGVDENMGIMYTIALTMACMVSMMACNSMPFKVPVVEMVEEAE